MGYDAICVRGFGLRRDILAGASIQGTIGLLQRAIESIDAEISLPMLERIGIMVNRAMTVEGRIFHSLEHIFDLADIEDPHITLAAIFHDLVYYNVDQGFTEEIREIISPYIVEDEGSLSLSKKIKKNDRFFWLTLGVFGFEAGQTLSPFGGMNEVLSALVMNRALGDTVSASDLTIVTACIEATIPFRAAEKNGVNPAEKLYSRLEAVQREFSLHLDAITVENAVKLAVTFANRDVENFSESDVARFLDNTWKLLPETNPSLRLTGIYSIKNYRIALQKMAGFLTVLDPDSIFVRYHGVPSEEAYRRMSKLARRNVATARDYLGIKLLTAAILEGLAEISGGDAPISLFMGDIRGGDSVEHIEDLLPEVEIDPVKVTDFSLYSLLAYGRASESKFDLQNSPLSLFIYLNLGADGFHQYLEKAQTMFDGIMSAEKFLDGLPSDTVAAIAYAASKTAFTREQELRKYADTHKKS